MVFGGAHQTVLEKFKCDFSEEKFKCDFSEDCIRAFYNFLFNFNPS